MHRYGVRDVEKLLRLPRSTIRTFIEAGFVTPSRGPRNAWQFSFQDLIVLRTAQALAKSSVPRQRITRSVKELRRHLPASMPLSGLSIGAVGNRVVVKEGARRWQADSGQYLLAFEGDPDGGSLSVIEERGERALSGKSSGPSRSPRASLDEREGAGPFREERSGPSRSPRAPLDEREGTGPFRENPSGPSRSPRAPLDEREGTGPFRENPSGPSRSPRAPLDEREGTGPFRENLSGPSRSPRAPLITDALEWFERGLALEKGDVEGAVRAYERAIAADPTLIKSRINLGGLLHGAGRHADAERVYRDAIEADSSDAVLHYNLGVLLEDMDRKAEAMEAYQTALHRDPDLADCHYNLALLCEEFGKPKEAIRHMARYRKLTEKA